MEKTSISVLSCRRSSGCVYFVFRRWKAGTYNIGAEKYGTMFQLLEGLINHAGGHRIRSLNSIYKTSYDTF